MADLITIEEARHHLRIDDYNSNSGPDDPWLNTFIPAISEAVFTWLKDDWRAYVIELDADGNEVEDSSGALVPAVDSSGNMTVKPAVKAACLVELAVQFRFRDGDGNTAVPSHEGHGYILCRAATALLAGLRKTTVK